MFAELECTLIRQRVSDAIAAVSGRRGWRPQLMMRERLCYARHHLADQACSIAAIRHEPGSRAASALDHLLHGNRTLAASARKPLDTELRVVGGGSAGGAPVGTTRVGVQQAHPVA